MAGAADSSQTQARWHQVAAVVAGGLVSAPYPRLRLLAADQTWLAAVGLEVTARAAL
jgi:hypothetical protein